MPRSYSSSRSSSGHSSSGRKPSSYGNSYSSEHSKSSPSITAPSSTALYTPVSSSNNTPVIDNTNQQRGFFSNMWQGFSFGTGSAIAHNIFRSNPVIEHKTVAPNTSSDTSFDPCNKLKEELLLLEHSSYKYSELQEKFESLCREKSI